MASFPVAASAIGLTVTTFTLCVEGLQAIRRARRSPGTMLNFDIGIDIETARLLLWGHNSGVAAGLLDPSLEPVRPLIDRILGTLLSGLRDAQGLKSKYGIRISDGQDTDAPAASMSMDGHVDILGLPVQVVKLALRRHNEQCKSLKEQTSVFQKTKWAIKDEKKASKLVKDAKSFVDRLNQLLTESQKASLDAETTAVKIAILGTNWNHPAKALAAIENATSGLHESIAMPARLSRLRLEMEMEVAAPTLEPGLGSLPQPLVLAHNQVRPLDFSRSLVRHGGRDMIIEWRHLQAREVSGEKGEARARQAARLVQLFQELRGHENDYPILECVGFVDNRHNIPARLGVAFAMPAKSLGPEASPPWSLHDYLMSNRFEAFLPSLGERFELARRIARGFLQFFQFGWHHKSIRSHIIGFFPENDSPTVRTPYIMGFAYSRPHEKGVSDQERRTTELQLYQHPEDQGRDEPGHKLIYDMYGIGMLLFEIGMWRSIGAYYARWNRNDRSLEVGSFGSKLIEVESANLEFRMGSHFKSAVIDCLTSNLGTGEVTNMEDPGARDLKLSYFEKVVKKLDLCRA
ncbi:prion-inhibition and propagation-domain-containing protein [Lasiosphaeris hirsuta]|uniref:Prion-inhibition and propagation-domain-containing protein n=1 Tax=Lasiosphaeris hirsuta TaxID=260670 RepID=A0AA40AHN5_9PEZI|nr:prion-inhibition and propagation-domain-containing protein [Lasiosphaeris hirsuta]